MFKTLVSLLLSTITSVVSFDIYIKQDWLLSQTETYYMNIMSFNIGVRDIYVVRDNIGVKGCARVT